MRLKNFIYDIDKKLGNPKFSGIAFDSQKVKKNYIFFAIRGNNDDGNDYIPEAIKKGAKIIISDQKNIKKLNKVIFLYSSNVRKLLAEFSYKNLKKTKKIVAVTGTNGKSSVADFFYQILNFNSKKVASIGTLGIKTNKKKKTLTNTTLNPIHLSEILKFLKKKKIEYIIMEASSHGLHQNRLDGLMFDVGIFTNLSHDHLDYHKNMDEYLKSKLYLFENLIKKKGNIISDATIRENKELKKISKNKNLNLKLIFDKKGIELISHRFEREKQILDIRFKNKRYNFALNLVGKIQIKNVLMAMIAAQNCGLKFENIIKVLKKLKSVEGRLEKIGNIKNNSRVILDYAHTPEALELALSNLREQFPEKKINLLFGCGGKRDEKKRPMMGKIAKKYSDKIYLTDDNPRNEAPSKIREDIKKGIKKIKVNEIPDRKKAIKNAINDLNTGEILLVAGKGHEKIQDYGRRKLFFSDKQIILKSIKLKNKSLSNDLKLNIIKEESNSKISNKLKIRKISINSREVKKNDIFFAIKGKKVDGNNFVSDAMRKKISFAVVNKINKNFSRMKQIKVENSLSFLTNCSNIYRENINAKIISITGSCGKTTLKEMMRHILGKISKTSFSKKSYNNKYGVPLSLINIKQSDKFGVLEVGMDKKGEIDYLSKIIKPDLGVITNISLAHSKNFKNINLIAQAKAEIIKNIKKNGTLVLNMDDKFFYFHRNLAIKKNLKVISFGIKNKFSMIRLIKTKRLKNKYELFIKVNNRNLSFYSLNINQSNIYNILATLASIYTSVNLKNLSKDIFLDFKIPSGRGDISSLKIYNKNIFLVDETYNSNPLSLKVAIENYDRIETKNSEKYLILGDMLELGKHSLKQHKSISKIINKTEINKVFVIGKYIKKTFEGLKENKKARILSKKKDIIKLIKNNLKNNDYLMIKGSNSTDLHKITENLKNRNLYAL